MIMDAVGVGVGRHPHIREIEYPSFSSTLLDAIYRSIDERDGENLQRTVQGYDGCFHRDQQDIAGFRRACMIEKWMEKKVCEQVVVRRKSAADLQRTSQRSERDSIYYNSNSSSSDSSCGGGFYSSESESVNGAPARPKPIRTLTTNQRDEYNEREKQISMCAQKYQSGDFQQKSKTKSGAMKIYGDLKKVKQPVSPGGRLATFLNSLFTAGNMKKSKAISSSYDARSPFDMKSKSANASTCSSASSFSRSCLSRTPSSRGKLSNGMKRSVRFHPASVTVDEDHHKPLYREEFDTPAPKIDRSTIREELKVHLCEKNRRIEEAARELLRNYQKKVECEFDLMKNNMNDDDDCEGDEIDINNEDDDDADSYASSDLFELENISAIGMERYHDELPVYETTHLDTNRAHWH